MRVLDLFAGLGGWTSAAADDDVVTVDLDPSFAPTIVADIGRMTAADLGDWRPDVILASPPCERFTVMQIGRNWHGPRGNLSPKRAEAAAAAELVEATLRLIDELAPAFWLVENPRAALRSLALMAEIPRRTVTYCQYGARTMKPTDLWGGFPPSLRLRPCCRPRATCHVSAPAGSKTGIQDGKTSAAERALVPRELSRDVLEAARFDLRTGVRAAPPRSSYLYQDSFGWPAPDRMVDTRPRMAGGRFARSGSWRSAT